MSYSRWTRLWMVIAGASLFLGGTAWIFKLGVVISTGGRVMYTGSAATLFDLGLILLLVGSTGVGLRLTADGKAAPPIVGIALSPLVFVVSFMILQGFVVALVDAVRAVGFGPGPDYVREEAIILLTAAVALVAGVTLLRGAVCGESGAARSSSAFVRWCGTAAMLGGALGIVMTPVLVYLWSTYSEAYLAFGKAYFLVYLGCAAGLIGLDYRRKGSPERPEAEGLGIGTTLVGLAVAFVGDLLAYWGDLIGGEPNAGGEFNNLQAGGFIIEMLGLVILLLGSVSLGDIYLRARVSPRWFAWMLILAGPSGILLSAVHTPSGTMLPFCLAWTAMGYALLSRKSAATEPVGIMR